MKIFEDLEIILFRNANQRRVIGIFVTVSAVHALIELLPPDLFVNIIRIFRKARQITKERGCTGVDT